MDPTLITACQMFLVPRHLAHASRRGQMEAAGFLDMSVEMLDRVYGHHHPDYLRSAARLIGYRRRETVPISVPVTLPTPGPATQAIENYEWAREDSNLQPDRYERPGLTGKFN